MYLPKNTSQSKKQSFTAECDYQQAKNCQWSVFCLRYPTLSVFSDLIKSHLSSPATSGSPSRIVMLLLLLAVFYCSHSQPDDLLHIHFRRFHHSHVVEATYALVGTPATTTSTIALYVSTCFPVYPASYQIVLVLETLLFVVARLAAIMARWLTRHVA